MLAADRAAALFGTRAAAAERHRATTMRCMVKLAQPIWLCRVTPIFEPLREHALKSNVSPVGRRETSLGGSRGVLYGVVPNKTPPAAVACQTRPRARGRDGQ